MSSLPRKRSPTPSPASSSSRLSNGQRVQVVHLPNFTDADQSHAPKDKSYVLVQSPTNYLRKCAELWMENQAPNQKISGVGYYLHSLPSGYRVYERPRPGNPKIVDRFLYGHPHAKSTAVFTSPNEFYPHFEYLQLNKGSSLGCGCKRCSSSANIPVSQRSSPSIKAASIRQRSSDSTKMTQEVVLVKHKPGRPSASSKSPVFAVKQPTISEPKTTAAYDDEEETPNVITGLFERLRLAGSIDERIEERSSMDWIATYGMIADLPHRLRHQPSWMPRIGEVVLYSRNLPDYCDISYDGNNKDFKIYDNSARKFLGPPNWEAGVVGQSAQEPLSIYDFIRDSPKHGNVTHSGFRIEPLPRPGSAEKSYTTRYKYLSIRAIRPFALYQDFLRGRSEESWHETVRNALLIMASVSVVGKMHITGKWPQLATISCLGLFIGSEYLSVGDAVRFSPRSPLDEGRDEENIDVLVIDGIQWQVSDMTEAQPLNNGTVRLVGQAFTLNAVRSHGQAKRSELHPTLHKYDGPIYRSHEPNKIYTISLSRIIGRVPEPEAMDIWLPGSENPLQFLTAGRDGVQAARLFARQEDTRIVQHQKWFLADDRLQALDVRSLNGVSSWRFDNLREEHLEAGHKAAKVLMRPTAQNQAAMREVVERPKAHEDAMGMHRVKPPSDVEDVKAEESSCVDGDVVDAPHGDSGDDEEMAGADAGTGTQGRDSTEPDQFVDAKEHESDELGKAALLQQFQLQPSKQARVTMGT